VALKLIINLPIRSVAPSIAFWQALGYSFDARYASDSVCSLILGDDIIAMLHEDAGFVANTDRTIADPHTTTEAIISIAVPTRADVDAKMTKALAHGAREFGSGADHGFIYHRSFVDLDGHQWEVFWMEATPA
jgi:predicted lactoylglutathione lyase